MREQRERGQAVRTERRIVGKENKGCGSAVPSKELR